MRVKNGSRTERNGWICITISGNAYERGFAYGELVAANSKWSHLLALVSAPLITMTQGRSPGDHDERRSAVARKSEKNTKIGASNHVASELAGGTAAMEFGTTVASRPGSKAPATFFRGD